eukprot:CAMPEP_0202909706 /NCGR_PEP_ID=MMETSP1392-20130828/50103_1 /ASSEMBLY_ACC=CAM_ASM_000868 /TAXON_ID=225041 /ORGANISM="Chlamydomonas chlamydogama, Strain SAG 11-48b" /LENGTH=41 /DNA_ID= /DNA_START= /DNA_END= /DNA_ORIENTATION=
MAMRGGPEAMSKGLSAAAALTRVRAGTSARRVAGPQVQAVK